MGTRNHATPDQSSAPKRAVQTPARDAEVRSKADEARKEVSATHKQEPAKGVKADKERSDWEGMAPRPEQGTDDVAAPGEVPKDQHD